MCARCAWCTHRAQTATAAAMEQMVLQSLIFEEKIIKIMWWRKQKGNICLRKMANGWVWLRFANAHTQFHRNTNADNNNNNQRERRQYLKQWISFSVGFWLDFYPPASCSAKSERLLLIACSWLRRDERRLNFMMILLTHTVHVQVERDGVG